MKSMRYVVLLRGVTPTGKNKVPMAELRGALEDTELEDVQTYIQSGNVLVSSSLSASSIEKLVHQVIKDNFGGELATVAKTRGQLEKIMQSNPFKKASADRQHFTLLKAKPTTERVQQFLTTDFSPDKVQAIGDVVYTLYATKHSDSKFHNNYYERQLNVAATTRNWNTMTKLVQLLSA